MNQKILAIVLSISVSAFGQTIGTVQAQTAASEESINSRVTLAGCVGRGGVEGVTFWGPAGYTCNGIPDWGAYDKKTVTVESIGSCKGRGGVEGVTLWGPVGELCGGIASWGEFSAPAIPLQRGTSACYGQGNILSGMVLWGPTGGACGGFSSWGSYTDYTTYK